MSPSPAPAIAFPLTPGDAVAAILVTPDRRFLMQHRDPVPHIWYPGAWGLFGGSIEPGESELEALRRELREEIALELGHATLFTRFRFDFGFADAGACTRSFYEVPIEAAVVPTLRLGEGRDMRLIAADQVLALSPIIGYDQFGLYLYLNRDRITAAPQHAP
ncbi:MAG: NUDIX domain-containing protein [Proteobacteria bacterium]|nr:NUDIX domain-containing protein [Pseudomonadota bacterium]